MLTSPSRLPLLLAENFGALPNINALYGTESDEDDSDDEEAARPADADKYAWPCPEARCSPVD
jgi:hypothetical protein